MSIRFPTDNDAGMSRPSAPRRGGGGKLIFMLIIGVVAFMVMRGMSSSGPETPIESNPTDRSGGISDIDFSDDLHRNRADQNDWGMEDGPVQKNAASKKPSTKSSNGDWGMENVATQPSAQQPVGRFSQPATAKEPTAKKPATQGDWGLDTDVETTPKPAEPNKTVKGDWSLEEVE